MSNHDLESSRLAKDAAHRLLARAVELDATRGTELAIAQLRAAAQDAGISHAAFEAALREWHAMESPLVTSMGAEVGLRSRMREFRAAVSRAALGAPVRNAVALAAFWGVLMLLVSFDRTAAVSWLARKAGDPLALAIGAMIALRLRARPVALLLAGLTISQGAEFVMDAALGAPAVQGFGSHLALMIAGVAGVFIGGRLRRTPTEGASVMVVLPVSATDTRPPVEQLRALTLGLNGA